MIPISKRRSRNRTFDESREILREMEVKMIAGGSKKTHETLLADDGDGENDTDGDNSDENDGSGDNQDNHVIEIIEMEDE